MLIIRDKMETTVRYPVSLLTKMLENYDNAYLQRINLDAPGVKYARESIKKDHIICSNMVGSIAGKFQEAMNKMTMDNSNNLINEILKLNFDESHESMLKISEVIYNKIVDEPFNNHIYILIFVGTINRNFKGKTLINYFINLAKNNFDQTFTLGEEELANMYFEREVAEDLTPIDKMVKKKCGLMRALVRMYIEKTYVSYDIIYNCLIVLIKKLNILANMDVNIKFEDEDDLRRYQCAVSYLYGSMVHDLLDEGIKSHKLVNPSKGNTQLNKIDDIKHIVQEQLVPLINNLTLSSVKNNLKTIIDDRYIITGKSNGINNVPESTFTTSTRDTT